jgi:hypothetical protein
MSSLLKNTLLTSVKKLTFNTESVGWHLIKVLARVKSKKQRGTVRRNSQQPIKLWSIILLLLSFPMFLSMFVLFYYQNRFFISVDLIPESKFIYSQDYRFVIHTLDGLQLQSFEIGHYAGNGANLDMFYKNNTLEIETISMPQNPKRKVLVVFGTDISSHKVVVLVNYSNGAFEPVTNISENRGISKIFHGENIIVENRDNDPELEVVEEYFIPYSNAPDEWWVSYFDFDREKEQYTLTHTDRIRS